MARKRCQKRLSRIAVAVLVCSLLPPCGFSQQADQSTPPAAGNPTEAVPQSGSQLQSLLAPIALYPDALVAQILTASTFPDQVAIASYWLQQNQALTGSSLMKAVDKQSWDPSVKALTEFPSVLANLAKNLTWTSSLGEAYHNQQAEVMSAIQTLRAQAKASGNLKTNSQITVQQTGQTIVIQPTNPQIVYVPEYNPAVIYGTPYLVPGYVAPAYSAGSVAAAGIIGFGAGVAVGALMSGGCCGWGYSSWNCGWHGTAVVYHGGAYYGNAGWHGGYYNGGYNSYNHNGYNRNSGNSYRNVSGNTVNMNRQSGQNFSDHSSAANSWAHQGSDSKSTAFSGLGGHSNGGFGNFGGWGSKAQSDHGWGSMHSSGFGGGRWGGGGFGGGRFGGRR